MVMEEKVNIAEILKDKPQGTKLYDLLRNIDVKLDEVHITDVGTYIECTSTNEVGSTFLFDYSKLGTEESWLDGLQILLPSKEMRDWSKLGWNTGDILVINIGTYPDKGIKAITITEQNDYTIKLGNFNSFSTKHVKRVVKREMKRRMKSRIE